MPDIELTSLPGNLHNANVNAATSTANNNNSSGKSLADGSIPLYHDVEKSSNPDYRPSTSSIQRKLILSLVAESVIGFLVYYKYTAIEARSSPLVAPTLLGAATASLAQSLNQYSRKKFSLNRICKFIVWGCINGCFTALWIDILLNRIDNLVYRIMVDQMVGAPAFQMIFSILNSLWDTGDISPSMRQSYLKALKYGYCFWPFFSICAFVFIPQSMIFSANCLATLIWNSILSRIS